MPQQHITLSMPWGAHSAELRCDASAVALTARVCPHSAVKLISSVKLGTRTLASADVFLRMRDWKACASVTKTDTAPAMSGSLLWRAARFAAGGELDVEKQIVRGGIGCTGAVATGCYVERRNGAMTPSLTVGHWPSRSIGVVVEVWGTSATIGVEWWPRWNVSILLRATRCEVSVTAEYKAKNGQLTAGAHWTERRARFGTKLAYWP